jgi:uncharacterized protein YbjT (DUF2867 family)
MNVLIVGATGQLGRAIAAKLQDSPHQVFALHRATSNLEPLRELPNLTLREGDLRQPLSIEKALEGIDVLICTANAVVPTQKGDTFKSVDIDGVKRLIEAAKAVPVKQFIYTSALPFDHVDRHVPLCRAKRHIERMLQASGLTYTIFQPTAFMDVHFAFMGTDLPLRGAKAASIERPFRFMNNFFNGIRDDMAAKGRFNFVGNGERKCSYISIDDTAEFHVKAVDNPKAFHRVIPIGGPENLSPLEVKSRFEAAYQKPLTPKSTPAGVMKVLSKIMAPFNIHAANIFAINYAGASVDNVAPNAVETAREFGVTLTSASAFIEEKIKHTPN